MDHRWECGETDLEVLYPTQFVFIPSIHTRHFWGFFSSPVLSVVVLTGFAPLKLGSLFLRVWNYQPGLETAFQVLAR